MTIDLKRVAHALTPLILDLFDESELTGRQITEGVPYLNPDWVWLVLRSLTVNGELVMVEGYKPRMDIREQVWRRPKL